MTIEDDGPDTCVVVTGAGDPGTRVLYLAMPGVAFDVLEPKAVADAALAMSALLAGAVRP
ncbi:hypothetical protein [Mycolicibacterium sarraceniae]|uniref:Uncharacterized protein n=1 Tax=Mycolicibacterium sarraceniae TaxID=1534348 RepID=A0A7I7SSP3_9MYCO|nr:hypothetical protein [Mycolicibacterium sarraceniae]BBY59381.1 hypothetical protein MSAR_25170 [Mycolicibacterium sarraceniae]